MLRITAALFVFAGIATADAADVISLSDKTTSRCLKILRDGMAGDDFWPAMHAAEGLTAGGHGYEVREALLPLLPDEMDDQHRCGLARELVRAGDWRQAEVMLAILAGDDPYGHVHAAESLYKVFQIGDGAAMRAAFANSDNLRLRIMAAAALGRCGNPEALDFLREQLENPDPELSRTAAWVLGRIGEKSDATRIMELAAASEGLTRAYYEHAAAALGDPVAKEALLENLRDEDPVIRTYAAAFATDARLTVASELLKVMLSDSHPDAAIRAAHALLAMSLPAPGDKREQIVNTVYEATAENPRYTEGSVVALNDGSLLFATTEFIGSGSDFAKARIIAKASTDGGRHWGDPRVLQENTGQTNVMSVTLRRLRAPAEPGTIALFYLQKNTFDDLRMYVRFSTDETQTFGEPVLVTGDPGYHVVNNDRVTQLSSGRLIVPAASTADVKQVNHFVSHCYVSDDGGQTWRATEGRVDFAKRGAMEPEVLELADGRLLMILRTQLGYIAASYSDDQGESWSEAKPFGVTAPEAPSTIRRIPATGDLLLIWNNTFQEGAGHGGQRTPLTAAVSRDDGRTWSHIQNLEPNPEHTYSYPSVVFVRDRAVLTYWESGPAAGQLSAKFRSLPVSRFYE